MTTKDETRSALQTWRDGLVNLTGTNRALNFRHSKTGSVEIEAPKAADILRGLRSGQTWSFRGRPDVEVDPTTGANVPDVGNREQTRSVPGSYVLRSPKPDKEVGSAVRNLARRAQAEFLDRGLSVLYVGLGALHWLDVDETRFTSPLLLVPVELIKGAPKELPTLRMGDDDVVINPALSLRLQELGVTMPTFVDLPDLELEAVLQDVRESVADRDGWTVRDDAVLSAFTFQKEAMYRDLLNNEGAVVSSSLVQALANQDPTTQNSDLLFQAFDVDRIDEIAPPESSPLVLDADSSQRACIAAAVAGHSFVMDGPPGTGKSQTIANMIGALLHAGKTVLFVSEKAAALEVVQNRLDHVGLGSYLMPLHSSKVSRKEVAAELLKALDSKPRPPAGMDPSDRRSVAGQRQQLSAYAKAMNAVRQPLGASLHDVMGRVAGLGSGPGAPPPSQAPMSLTRDDVEAVKTLSRQLRDSWRVATQGTSYLWRYAVDESPLGHRLARAGDALEELESTVAHNATVRTEFGFGQVSDIGRMITLLDLATRRPPGVLDEWLTTLNLNSARTVLDEVTARLNRYESLAGEFRQATGIDWAEFPDLSSEGLDLPDLAELRPNALSVEDDPEHVVVTLRRGLESTGGLLERSLVTARQLGDRLGFPAVDTFADIEMVLASTKSAFETHRPCRSWLSVEGLEKAREARRILKANIDRLVASESAAMRLFTDRALGAPLEELYERFTSVHKGFRKLLKPYRRDKEAVRAIKSELATLQEAIDDLSLAVAWGKATNEMIESESDYAAALGHFWNGRTTDFAAIDAALNLADHLLRIVPPTALDRVADHVTSVQPESAMRTLAERTAADLAGWREGLVAGNPAAGSPELALLSVESAVDWLRSHFPYLDGVVDRLRRISGGVGRPVTHRQVTRWQDQLGQARAAREELFDVRNRVISALGESNWAGTATDVGALRLAIDWAAAVRHVRFGQDAPLTDAQTKSLVTARPGGRLRAALDHWTEAARQVSSAFGPQRQPDLTHEFDSISSAFDLIAELQDDPGGQSDWFAYLAATAGLAQHGLAPAVDYCVTHAAPAESVPDMMERAILLAWTEGVLRSDTDLRPLRAQDHDDLIKEFRRLDRELIRAATSEVITAVNGRRPASADVGEPALIRREGMKKTRHRPVRDLIGQTRATVLKIKPCFMMSPLAVSQYLPSDMRFDVVIFDEASQVTPGDAINCVYRGRALITAGDDRQLPPTSFFDRVNEGSEDATTDVADFQSVLELSKASGGFRNLGLRWHYRSQHEALIAFSNQRFYDGRLVTYPGALSSGPDVGVELISVPGVYRRGTTRDNPAEAEAVAERVIRHFETRPDATLGVVTFSITQADAISDAIDRARERRPDLEHHFADDRLRGMFVKSLESVQGDERDVMIFSIGYGFDENHKLYTNFGALNKPKGWRRLNVAITRARQRVEIVSTIRASDIPSSDNESVNHLIAYLDYAERGLSALALSVGADQRGTESPFEESVLRVIASMGYEVETQVGTAGYRIDLAVRHPDHPGAFALGVECDGYAYHSAPAARDRDRLRQDVLEGLGWRLHRIWGTSWHRNRTVEEERLRAAIEAAVSAELVGRLAGRNDWRERVEVDSEEILTPEAPSWSTPYRSWAPRRLPTWVNPSSDEAWVDMIGPIEALVDEEGPIHIELLVARLRDAWGVGRVGGRIRTNIESAITQADVSRTGDFVDVPARETHEVRVPAGASGQRTVVQVPPGELRDAIGFVLRDSGGVDTAQLTVAIARVFGWARVGSDIKVAISNVVLELQRSGFVTVTDDIVRRTPIDKE